MLDSSCHSYSGGGSSSSSLPDEDRKALNQGLLVNTLELVGDGRQLSSNWLLPSAIDTPVPCNNLCLQTRSFEQVGLPRSAAEDLAERIATLIVTNKQRMDEGFVSKKDLEKVRITQPFLILPRCSQLLCHPWRRSTHFRTFHMPTCTRLGHTSPCTIGPTCALHCTITCAVAGSCNAAPPVCTLRCAAASRASWSSRRA